MVAKSNIQVEYFVPEDWTPFQRNLLGKLIINQIQDNCSNNIDKNGKAFKPYSKSYVESFEFMVAEKSQSDVNLQLTGDMLASMEVLESPPGKVVVGYRVDSPYAGQVEGNVIGSYGGTANKSHARDFLGVTPSQLKLLIATVNNTGIQQEERVNKIDNIVSAVLKRFL